MQPPITSLVPARDRRISIPDASKLFCGYRNHLCARRIFVTFLLSAMNIPLHLRDHPSSGRSSSFPDRIHNMLLATIIRAVRTYLKYRTTLMALRRLDDRTLDDIGINRSQLAATAWDRAHA
jgi:uncharacterized protein YjiS (DUF1127 family)